MKLQYERCRLHGGEKRHKERKIQEHTPGGHAIDSSVQDDVAVYVYSTITFNNRWCLMR